MRSAAPGMKKQFPVFPFAKTGAGKAVVHGKRNICAKDRKVSPLISEGVLRKKENLQRDLLPVEDPLERSLPPFEFDLLIFLPAYAVAGYDRRDWRADG